MCLLKWLKHPSVLSKCQNAHAELTIVVIKKPQRLQLVKLEFEDTTTTYGLLCKFALHICTRIFSLTEDDENLPVIPKKNIILIKVYHNMLCFINL